MASSNEYLQFILDQLSELDEITYRAMMGEYIIGNLLLLLSAIKCKCLLIPQK